MSNRQIAVDLGRNWMARVRGDLLIFGTWIWNEAQEDTEPCLAILPAHRKALPCIVTLGAVHKYENPRYTEIVARDFAQSFGMQSDAEAYQMAEAILSNLGDLLGAPYDPTEAVEVGEVVIHDGSRRRTASVLDYEQIT